MSGEAMVAIYVPNGRISVPAEAVARIEEWANWARPRVSIDSHGRCASAEGRYDSEYPDAARTGSGIKYDLQAVLGVERVVCTKLPRVHREIIRRHFVFRHDPKIVSMALSVHRSQYGHELKRSVLMVKNNLNLFSISG